jgi:NAD(P)-dependent dehydrogenase (short-subunit alcohol dehydrogenase family)
MTSVSGKTAFITGGASGIGLGIAGVFGAAGARIVIADVEPAALERAVTNLAASGIEAQSIQLDVTDRAAFAAARDATIRSHGAVHLLFNNAGVNVPGPLHQVGYQDWDWVLGVNLGGVVNGITTFLPELMRHGADSHVINTASVGGLVGMRNLGIYNASKFAVVGLSEALRADLLPHGVKVSVLCPGVVATAPTDSERNRPAHLGGSPERAAPADGAPAAGMSPEELARLVLEAVQSGEFFISSHPEFRDLVGQRNEAVQRSFHGAPEPAAVEAMRALIEPF